MEKGPVPEIEYMIELGKEDIKRPGRDVTIIG
jgi:pyruvate/2-oxoglutarate/acetoin dehydrogenase E1 component